MAKVQLKTEKITPFGGLFHERAFPRYMVPIIDTKYWASGVRHTAICTARLWVHCQATTSVVVTVWRICQAT